MSQVGRKAINILSAGLLGICVTGVYKCVKGILMVRENEKIYKRIKKEHEETIKGLESELKEKVEAK